MPRKEPGSFRNEKTCSPRNSPRDKEREGLWKGRVEFRVMEGLWIVKSPDLLPLLNLSRVYSRQSFSHARRRRKEGNKRWHKTWIEEGTPPFPGH